MQRHPAPSRYLRREAGAEVQAYSKASELRAYVAIIYVEGDYGPKPMMIRSLYIQKLFDEYDYDLDICRPLAFIHSQNGMGKSTIMRMINAALRGDVKALSEAPFERMDIGFDDDTVMIIENDKGALRVQMQKNELETPITPDEMAEVCKVIYIPSDRLAQKKRDGHLSPTLETYAQELYEHIRYAVQHSALEPHPELVGDLSDGELEFWSKDLKAKLDFIKDAGFEPEIPAGMKFPPSRYEINKDRQGYAQLVASISDYVKKNYLLAESIIIYKDVVNEIFLNKTLKISESGRASIAMDNGSSLMFRDLSSGEKEILIMFYALLFHADPGSLVIMDEPELSLHVSWQQMLGKYFLDICRVRSLQMIVATHSPQVIHDMWDQAIELRPADARVPLRQRYLQPDVDGALCLRRAVPCGRRSHGREALREVHRQGLG